MPKNNICRDSVYLSLPKDQQEENIYSRTNIITSDIDINEELKKIQRNLFRRI